MLRVRTHSLRMLRITRPNLARHFTKLQKAHKTGQIRIAQVDQEIAGGVGLLRQSASTVEVNLRPGAGLCACTRLGHLDPAHQRPRVRQRRGLRYP